MALCAVTRVTRRSAVKPCLWVSYSAFTGTHHKPSHAPLPEESPEMVFLLDVDFQGSLEISAPVGQRLRSLSSRPEGFQSSCHSTSGFEWLSSLVQKQPGAPYNAPDSVFSMAWGTQLAESMSAGSVQGDVHFPELTRGPEDFSRRHKAITVRGSAAWQVSSSSQGAKLRF